MSQVTDAFNQLLELEPGQKLQLDCETLDKLHSIRTMFYQEAALFHRKTGIKLPLSCFKRRINDRIILEVSIHSPITYKIIGESNEPGQ